MAVGGATNVRVLLVPSIATQVVDQFHEHLYQTQNLVTLAPPKSTKVPLVLVGILSTVIVIFLPAKKFESKLNG